jgi:23S rRNA pseudouridine1911/1915/1917 synthase
MDLPRRWRPGDRFLLRHVDAALIVVEKAAGLLTHDTDRGGQPNLLSMLRTFMAGRRSREEVLPVHRLDRVVSGLLVFARTRDAQAALQDSFSAHDVERRYLAAVDGLLPDDEGTFESILRTDHSSLRVFSVDREGPGTRRAITHFRVLERIEASATTLIEVQLETGVRNQIRVHLAEAGFPLLGERKYLESRESQGAERVFLHARVLGFQHPVRDEPVRWEAEVPPDLARWTENLRAGKKARR